MPLIPFPGFCGPTYIAASPVIDCQDSINLYPEPGIDTSKSKMAMIGRPGLSQTGFATTIASPVRALWAGNNRLFAVGGTHFYELDPGGGVLHDYGAMAGSSGVGPAYIIANGTQLLVCDPSVPQLYNANSATFAMDVIQIGGVNLTGRALEYLDGFYITIPTGSALAGANPNQINVSANGDGTTWAGLNFVFRTGSSDLVTQLAVLQSQLWIFGEKTIEVWYNAGNPNFPFARVQGATINVGLMAPASVVKFYNTIMWLGADATGYAQIYMAKGLSPVRVSNAAIENLIGGVTAGLPGGNGATLPLAMAFGYQEAGHTFYVLNLVSQTTYLPYLTLVYDLTTGLWHERLYGVSGPAPVCFASVPGFNSNGPNFVGDSYSGKVMFQGIGYPSDLGGKILYKRTAPHVSDRDEWLKYSRLEIDGDFGTAQPKLDYSNDGGRTFGGYAINMQQAQDKGTPAASPTFRRFYATQLGRSRDRVFRVSIYDDTNLIRIANAYLAVQP